MVFSPPLKATLTITLHAAVLAVLTTVVVLLLAATHYYATALVLSGLAIMTVVSLSAAITRLERPLVQVLNDLLAGDMPRMASAQIGVAAAALQNERHKQTAHIEYLQALIDSMATALFAAAPDGRITLANHAARALAGEEASSLSALTAIGSVAAQEIMALPPGGHKIVKLANGQQVLASIVCFARRGEAPTRLIALQRIVGQLDVVELKAWQDLARILAHEMMNSLTPITSLSESLLARLKNRSATSPAMNDEAAEAIEIISRRAQGLMAFVEHYRAFAELPPPVIQSVAAAPFVAGLDGLMRATMANNHVDYGSEIVPADMVLRADPQLLEQAIINLLKNAVEAVSGTDRPAITLSVRDNDSQIAIAVTDSGAGLSAEQIESIFVPFFTTKPRGSGIGLSLARQITAAHGGQIEVKSSPTEGTVFRIILPK